MKKILAIVAFVATFAANAATIGAHLGTYHDTGKWCNFNPGLYFKTDSGLTVGGYRNSECRKSFYAGYTVEYGKDVRVAVTTGVITGYKIGTIPLFAPSVAMNVTEQASLRLTFIPKIEPKGANAFHLSTEYKF